MRWPWINNSFTSRTNRVLSHPIFDDCLMWNVMLEDVDSKTMDNWSPPTYISFVLVGELP